METTGRWVRYGAEAATALREAISAAKGAEPLAPVTVVVPSNQVGVSARRLLASGRVGAVCGAGPGLIGVTFATPYRLAELLGAPALALAGRRPVSTPVLGAAIRRALAAAPGAFGPVASHAATEAALVATYRELRDLDDGALDALAATGRRAAEVVRLHRAARAALAERWYDEEDLMASATLAVEADGAPPEVGALVVHLPQRLTRHGAELLAALGRAGGLSVVAGATGVARADAEVRAAVARLGVDPGPPPEASTLPAIVGPATTSVLTASDADDEVRAAVRTVIDAARAGTPLDRVAILHAAREPYARLLQHHLDAAGVRTNGAATVPVAGRVAGRTLLDLLSLPLGGWRRQDVFAWLAGAPILDDGRWVPATSWEQLSRRAGVVAGRADWDRRLEHLAASATADADELEARLEGADDGRAWRVDRDRRTASRARSLRRFVLGLVDRLDEAEAPAAWSDRVAWARALVADLLGGTARRAGWPEAERRAAERLDLALDRLAVLDELEGPAGLDVFTRALATELDEDLGRAGRFGEGVLVGPLSMGVGVDLDLMVLVGMAEGTFPATLRDDSLLPDEDREAAGGGLALRSGHVDRLHHQLLAVLAGAERQVLCVPRGDLRRSRERVPSRWVLDVATTLRRAEDPTAEPWWSDDLLEGRAPWLTHHASFDAAVRAAVPATDTEHRLRHLLHLAPRRGALVAAADRADPHGTLAGSFEMVEARHGRHVTRFDGNLAGLPIPSPADGASATSLERWASCPHAYLLGQLLGVEPLEQPEDALQITPIDRGNLIHLALERFVGELIDGHGLPAPDERWSDDHRARLAAIAAELCDEAEAEGKTGRTLFWRRDQLKILRDLDRFLDHDDAHRRAAGATPVAAELPFGRRGADPLAFPLPDGRRISLRGLADRVDVGTDGTLHVLDYKTGRPDRFRGLSADDPHQGGTHLQLAIYGLAARQALGRPDAPVRADYWFTSPLGRYRKIGYEVTDEVLASVTEAVATIVDGVEGGMFAPNPPEPTTRSWPDCWYCDPDNLGTVDLRRRWDRMRDDPFLARYLALVEPDPSESSEEAP